MTRVAILPYRKLGFARVFGFTVRDLMILRVLAACPQIDSIDWFERPGLPHEYLRDAVKGVPDCVPKLRVHSGLDLGVIGALRQRRAWTDRAMRRHDSALAAWAKGGEHSDIILDFNPFHIPDPATLKTCIYWYDLIDTFTKHNRFTAAEKAAVARKYAFVRKHADLVTGVTEAAVAPFAGTVLANRLVREDLVEITAQPTYDLGYLGFITDKFDLESVRRFAAEGFTILICGHAYDKRVAEDLMRIQNVTYRGAFTAAQAPGLIAQFRVGMVPYKPELSHDESPIKFFQYLAYGRPAILSARFNAVEDRFPHAVRYFQRDDIADATHFVRAWASGFAAKSDALRAQTRAAPDLFWDQGIAEILERLGAGTPAYGSASSAMAMR